MEGSSLSARLLRAYEAFWATGNALGEAPVASFPFVSGDTFQQMADHVLTGNGVSQRFGTGQGLFFASAALTTTHDFVSRAEAFVDQLAASPPTLLIHNGDHIPPAKVLERLGDLFSRVFCVNVINETERIRALPIGLENARLNNNGRLVYYLEGLETARSIDRSRLVVSSFHPSNNPTIREPTAELFHKSRFGFQGHSWKRRQYREMLKDTCFVISPPGNGPDCHRTWEAIYMGAVPVILKDHLAQSLFDDMPILALDSYEEFLEQSDEQLRDTYRQIVAKPATKAFASHWVKELR